MEMLIRTVFFYLLYLKYRIIYRKQIYFRGFSVVCAMKGSIILFDNAGGSKINIFSHPFSNMFGLSQRCIIMAKKRRKDSHQRRGWDEWVYHLLYGKYYHRAQY